MHIVSSIGGRSQHFTAVAVMQVVVSLLRKLADTCVKLMFQASRILIGSLLAVPIPLKLLENVSSKSGEDQAALAYPFTQPIDQSCSKFDQTLSFSSCPVKNLASEDSLRAVLAQQRLKRRRFTLSVITTTRQLRISAITTFISVVIMMTTTLNYVNILYAILVFTFVLLYSRKCYTSDSSSMIYD